MESTCTRPVGPIRTDFGFEWTCQKQISAQSTKLKDYSNGQCSYERYTGKVRYKQTVMARLGKRENKISNIMIRKAESINLYGVLVLR